MEKHKVGTDVTVLSDQAEVPGIGHLAVNTFVLHAEQPMVDRHRAEHAGQGLRHRAGGGDRSR